MVKPFSPAQFLKLCIFNPSPFAKQSTPIPPTFLQILHFSTSHLSPGPAYASRRHEEESRNVRVAVWWDFENCTLPNGVNVFKVARSITAAIRANGIKGPIQITAFGDVMQLSRSNQEALSSTGINLTHIPNGGKNSADRSLLVDLMYWVSQNPPPAHLFLISGDRDFAGILHRLRMSNYNILLASQESAPGVLCSAASIMWQWKDLLRGENLSGRNFNQPPDGPYGSWYGHYRAPLEDPFVVHEQPGSPRVEELSESGPDPKPHPIPKPVIKQIRQILYSYPKGIPITDLRSELAKSNVTIDKDYYGHKKFSRFLLAMPQIVRLQPVSDGQFLVCGITPNVPEENESISSTVSASLSTSGVLDSVSVHNLNGEKRSVMESMDEKLSLSLVQEPKMRSSPTKSEEPKQAHGLPKPYTEGMGERPSPVLSPESKAESVLRSEVLRKLQETREEALGLPKEAQESSPSIQVVGNNEVMKNQLSSAEEHSTAFEPGIFKRIWKKWFGSEVEVMQGKESIEVVKNPGQKVNTEEKNVKLTSFFIDSIAPPSVYPSSEKVAIDEQFAESSPTIIVESKRAPNVFSQIMSWFRSWRSSQETDGSCENSGGEMNTVKLDSLSEQLFSKESFWNEMQSFLDTPQGSALVLQSRTRMQMAHNLRMDGPSVLGSLSDHDLLQLVDLLISDKKWMEECAFSTSPFKLTRTTVEDTSTSHPHGSSGLSSIFLDIETQSNSLKKKESSGDKKCRNSSLTGVPQRFDLGEAFGKSRREILADCQSLVEFIVKEHPEGFNMGSFRRLFLERYGYPLEIEKLGYRKLATLLQIMPGIRIESTYILPSGKGFTCPSLDIAPSAADANGCLVANLDNEFADVSRKDDNIESPWDELGPIADADRKKEMNTGVHNKAKDETSKQVNNEYELLSEDDFSDSEDEILSSTKSEDDKNHRVQEVDSSLIQILSAWYGSQEGTNRKDKSDIGDGLSDDTENSSAPSTTAGVAPKNGTAKSKYRSNNRLSKSYSFVADQQGDDEDKLIDVILGRCKKQGERSTEAKM